MADSFIESARRRPGMYVGDVHDGSGLHHMLWQVLADAVDQVVAGHCSHVDLVLCAEGASRALHAYFAEHPEALAEFLRRE